MGSQAFFLSWLKGSSGAANTEELNWIVPEWGGGNARSLVELSKAVGGLPVSLKEGCGLLTSFKLL